MTGHATSAGANGQGAGPRDGQGAGPHDGDANALRDGRAASPFGGQGPPPYDGWMTAIIGPTAAGKSAVAAEVARTLGAEIVAVDAFTIYRGMDIGTAKAAVPGVGQHMVDELDPSQACTAQWFQRRARSVIAAIVARGAHPLLVGGSGLYFRAVVDPLEFPPTDGELRQRLERQYADAASAYAAVHVVDPDTARRIDPGNRRRAIRALEVHQLTGRPFSSFQAAWDDYRSVYSGLRVIGVDVPRAELTTRIEARVDAMLDAGWLAEAAALQARDLSSTARAAIGYAELWDHLAGACTLDEARTRIVNRTRRYAVRQQRWFAADPRVRWMDRATATEWLAQHART